MQVEPEDLEQKKLEVQTRHVLRAYDTLALCHGLLNVWITGSGAPKMDAQSSKAAESGTHLEHLRAAAKSHKWPIDQCQPFVATQAEVADVETDERREGSQAAPEEHELLSQSDLPSLGEGFGPDGKSVQDPAHGEAFLSDKVARLQAQLICLNILVRYSKTITSTSVIFTNPVLGVSGAAGSLVG